MVLHPTEPTRCGTGACPWGKTTVRFRFGAVEVEVSSEAGLSQAVQVPGEVPLNIALSVPEAVRIFKVLKA